MLRGNGLANCYFILLANESSLCCRLIQWASFLIRLLVPLSWVAYVLIYVGFCCISDVSHDCRKYDHERWYKLFHNGMPVSWLLKMWLLETDEPSKKWWRRQGQRSAGSKELEETIWHYESHNCNLGRRVNLLMKGWPEAGQNSRAFDGKVEWFLSGKA